MKYAFFQGCNIPIRIKQYATSTEAVFNTFGIELRSRSGLQLLRLSGAQCRREGISPAFCHGIWLLPKKWASILWLSATVVLPACRKLKVSWLRDSRLKDELNGFLTKESLQYSGKVQIKHFLTVLYEDIGIEKIKSRLVNRINDLNISVIHGCHILRPREITTFDDSFVPRITDELVQLTGVTSLDWRGKLECCGAALAGINPELSNKLLQEKISGAEAAGADYITPVCSYCHLQFDTAQKNIPGDQRQRQTAAGTPLPTTSRSLSRY